MSCAKFLSVTALCLGLASFAAIARAAQPEDSDLEALFGNNGPVGQAVSTDADTGTNLSDQNEPALLPSNNSNYSTRNPSRSNSDWQQLHSVRHDVRQTSLNSDSNYGVASSDDDMTQPAMPTGPRSRAATSAQSQQPRVPANSIFSDNNSQSPHFNTASLHDDQTPESIGHGGESCGSGGGGSCDSCDSCDGECSDCVRDNCCFSPCGCPGWFAGADYLLVRPDFSDAPAFVRITGSQPADLTYTMIQQKFNYQSAVRTFFGYRTECGDEIRFTYWNLQDGGSLTVNGNTTDVAYGGQFMTRANNPGDFLTNTANLEMNVYDIDYVKCCCNPCGCQSCCCPVWTLSYSAGIRVASMRRTDNTIQSLAEPTTEPTAGFISASFIGAGPRVGLEGHRYFRGTRASLFARGNIALLLGEYDTEQSVLVTDPSRAVTHLIDNHDRIIPETDIEIGADWQATCRLKFSAGYLFQAWWDLGEFEHVDVNGAGFILPAQNATILGFDGLFARVEYTF